MVALLLVGFNRPEFTIKHLNQTKEVIGVFDTIYLFVDGPRENYNSDFSSQEKIKEHLFQIRNEVPIISQFRKKNLGLSKNIKDAITTILQKHQTVIVLEDDVEITISGLISIQMQLEAVTKMGMLNPVIGMSGITKKRFITGWIKNEWRSSRYFSAWGYGVNRYFWAQHLKLQLDKSSTHEQILEKALLLESSKRKRNIWKERFNRGIYDYEIQETLFALEIKTFAPRFRIVGNIGHGPKATNTSFATPRYLHGSLDDSLLASNIKLNSHNNLQQKALSFMDSKTFGGDSLTSIRGRTHGIRSCFRSIFQAS